MPFCLLSAVEDSRAVFVAGILNWEDYMDAKKVSVCPVAPMDTFLDSCDFGRELLAGKTSEAQEFRVHCRAFFWIKWLLSR